MTDALPWSAEPSTNRVGRLGHPEELEPASSWRRAEPLPKVAADPRPDQ